MSLSPERRLAEFAATLAFDAIPAAVIRRGEDLLLDWFGSALAGKGMRPVEIIAGFAQTMGPAAGPSEILVNRRTTSPLFAAMVNALATAGSGSASRWVRAKEEPGKVCEQDRALTVVCQMRLASYNGMHYISVCIGKVLV